MSYQTIDESVQSSEPVWKVVFTLGATEYRYTSAAYFISDSDGTFEPVPMRFTEVTQNNDLARNDLKIQLPRTNVFAQEFLGFGPEFLCTLTVFRDLDGFEEIFWKGRVISREANVSSVELVCENVFTSLTRAGARGKYQRSCRHSLYSTNCGAHDYDFATAATVIGSDGRTVTVTDIVDSTAGQSSGYYAGGMLQTPEGYYRYIIAQSDNVLTLMSPLPTDTLAGLDSNGIAVTLYPGCDHTKSDCLNKFDNVLNFGGFPYFGSKNPFRGNVTGSIA